MEEKIVRLFAIVMAMLSVLICSSLYVLPQLQINAEKYIAGQLVRQRERQQRQQMWETLSGLEFLNYSTRQASILADASQKTSDGSLELPAQLRLELPKGATQETVTIENHYVTRQLTIHIAGAAQDYLVQYPMIGSSDHIEDLSYYADETGIALELTMEHVYEPSLEWDGQYLYIDFIAPRQIYDTIVVIDAGHGGDTPGAIYEGVEEKDIDLSITRELKSLFDEAKDEDIGVYYTRLEDTNPTFAQRADLANDLEADMFISIHNNSYPADTSVHGTAVLYDEERSDGVGSSKDLAGRLLTKLCDKLSSKNMGLVQGHDIYVVRSTDAPAALIEVGFMTNREELGRLQKRSYQKKCARAIYQVIMEGKN